MLCPRMCKKLIALVYLPYKIIAVERKQSTQFLKI